MKLLNCIHSIDRANGGPANLLAEMSFCQKEAGFEMEVVSLDDPRQPPHAKLACALHMVGPSLPGYGFTARLVPWLASHAGSYDAVLVHGIWQYSSFGTWLALHRRAIPYFVFPHGMLDPWFNRNHPLKRIKKMLYWPWAEFRVLADASAVLFTSEEERQRASQSFQPYRCKEIVVGLASSQPARHLLPQARELFLAAFPHLRDKKLLLFLGRIHKKKGVDTLLSVFAEVAACRPDLELVLAGPCSSEYQAQLTSLTNQLSPGIRQQVTCTGMLLEDLKWGAFAAADAFILPSHQENFAIAAAEALACGTPVLLSDKVNIWRDIQDFRAGFIDCDDAPGVKNLINQWLSASPEKLDELRANARRCYEERFAMGPFLERLLTTLSSAAPSKNQPG